jgi:hypothetical protein
MEAFLVYLGVTVVLLLSYAVGEVGGSLASVAALHPQRLSQVGRNAGPTTGLWLPSPPEAYCQEAVAPGQG